MKAGALIAATTEPQRRRLVEDVRALHRSGAGDDDVRLLSAEEASGLVRVNGTVAASFTAHCARVDPARLVRGLADACERRGVKIYERTTALEVGPAEVRCAQGRVRADCVIRATEAYTTQLPGEHLRFLPLYSFMIATEPLSASVWDELGWCDGLVVGDNDYGGLHGRPRGQG